VGEVPVLVRRGKGKMIRAQDALDYHSIGRRGKVEVIPTKPCSTQRDLSLAYTPGVAEPCREIHKNLDAGYMYTAKGNLVAVVTNGTAVLGLGDIGPLAGKPVMEGKGVLFKRFADIDVFDLEVDTKDPDELIKVVKLLEPTFGGINLEDIKAPECFYIEETLKKEMNIPVFHDDQHGTAIISGAGLINALEMVNKKIEDVIVVFNGAGAAGIACADLYLSLGVRKENIILCDSKGVVYTGRKEGMNPYKERYAVDTKLRTLEDAMKGSDVFVGVSVKDCVTPKMLKSMAEKPIVFAMANPDPEISYDQAVETRKDVIMATGRSDFPNQVNNVLGFPFIFRGALDVAATEINDEMKIAASQSLAQLAREDVPDAVAKAYGRDYFQFGPDYIIPKPLDLRVLLWEAPAVAKAAMDTGVARIKFDLDEYKDKLEAMLGKSREVMRTVIHKAQAKPKRVVFPEGDHDKVLRASQIIIDEKIAKPILLGNKKEIEDRISELRLDLPGIEIVQPSRDSKFEEYANILYQIRNRKGVTMTEARKMLKNRTVFGSMMVRMGDADGLIAGVAQHYPDTIRPALQVLRLRDDVHKVCGLYMLIFKNDIVFIADTSVNIEPTAEDLAEITFLSAETVRRFDIEPKVAMLSFSNFGSVPDRNADKVRKAVELIRKRDPGLIVDGEMQADTAVTPEIIKEFFPFSKLSERANLLICPNLESANIAYKLLNKLGGAEAIGPIMMGLKKPVHVLHTAAEVADVVNMAAIAVVDAIDLEKRKIALGI
jgi:malate dehydrogenase (oxaloacetate-decarboxylating)(NADP+)